MGKRRASTRGQSREPAPDKPYLVFLSHATADKWIATVLCEKIEEKTGARTFRDDRDINGGDNIPKRLREAIDESSEMVVLLSPESCGRQWVNIEIGAAWFKSEDFRIVPILYHVTIDQVPPILKDTKAFSLNDVSDYLKELAERVRGHHG